MSVGAVPLKCLWYADWMNEWGNETTFLALKKGGDRERLEFYWREPATDQVRPTKSVTIVTIPCNGKAT